MYGSTLIMRMETGDEILTLHEHKNTVSQYSVRFIANQQISCKPLSLAENEDEPSNRDERTDGFKRFTLQKRASRKTHE